MNRALKWLALLATVFGGGCLVFALAIPADADSAWLWGYSKTRLALIVIVLLVTILSGFLTISFISENRFAKNVLGAIVQLEKSKVLVDSFAYVMLLLVEAGGIAVAFFLTTPDERLAAIGLRLLPLVLLVTLDGLLLLGFVFGRLDPARRYRLVIQLGLTLLVLFVIWGDLFSGTLTDNLINVGIFALLAPLAVAGVLAWLWTMRRAGHSSPSEEQTLLEEALPLISFAAALGYVILFLYIAISRMAYPFELEWMEGGYITHMQRLLDGQRLYVEPSFDFVSYIYPPLYVSLAALVARFSGVDFFALRLVSFLATLGCFGLIFAIVRQRTKDSQAALLAVGVYAATFPLTGGWFDVGRVDALFLCFLLGAFFVLTRAEERGRLFLGAVLLAAAFFTKQTALLFILVCLVSYLLLENWKTFSRLGLATAILIVVPAVLLDQFTDGWFSYYVLEVPRGHSLLDLSWIRAVSLEFWQMDVLLPLAITALVGAAGMVVAFNSGGEERRVNLLSIFLVAGLFLTSWVGRLNPGGYKNVLLSAYAGLAILFGMGFSALTSRLGANQSWRNFLYLAVIVQFCVLAYPPGEHLPTPEHRQMSENIVAFVEDIDADVFVPYHNYLAYNAGKPSYLHWVSFQEMTGQFSESETAYAGTVQAEIEQAIKEGQFGALIFDNPYFDEALFAVHYTKVSPEECFGVISSPTTGWEGKPILFYIANEYVPGMPQICPAMSE